MKERLFLVDAYALIFKSYYAFLQHPMRNRQGVNTSPIFGFVKFIRDIIARERPHHLGVAFDPPGGNFRNELYAGYKANRGTTPEEIITAVPYIKRFLEAMQIPILQVAGYEADDVIGTLARQGVEQGFEVYMVTPDKDFGQLVSQDCFIYKQGKNGEGIEIVGCERLREQYGVDDPRLIIDILALWGDASDNIPGARGIGEKGAIKLVGEFGAVENLLAHTDQLKGKMRENVEQCADQILLSKQLATIDRYVPIDFEPEKLVMAAPDCAALETLFSELDFRMFLQQMQSGANAFSQAMPGEHRKQETGNRRQETGGRRTEAGERRPEAGETLNSQLSTLDSTPHTYHTLTTAEQVAELAAMLAGRSEFCFDTETTGIDPLRSRLVGISISVEPFEAWYVTAHFELLRAVFENEQIAKIGQNLKFDILVLRGAGIGVRGMKYDTMVLHYLLDADGRHGMNALAARYLDYAPIEIEALIGRGAKQLTMDAVPLEQLARYAAEDADVTLRLKQVLWPLVVEEGFEYLYRTIEEPLIDVLVDMELSGVKIDAAMLQSAGEALQGELVALEEQIRALSDEPDLNVNSPRQLGLLLFEQLKLDPKPKRTKTKQYRTDEEYLLSLSDRHPVVGTILEYRGLKKLLSTYIEALPLLIDPRTGRIHTSFNQTVTATGRLSSTDPNLQNIPIRSERGREIRRAFVPADADHLLLSADYSQVELRLMAHFSGDEALIEAFRQGEDIHAATAARLYHTPLGEVSSSQRRNAKMVNFGIIYGISSFGLAQRLGIPRGEAQTIIDDYFAAYPGVKRYMERVIRQARADCYVTTLFGRRRPLPDIRSSNGNVRAFAERNAINAPLQGSAADIIKLAMIAVHRRFGELGLRSKLILQVHDELVIDLYKPERAQVERIVVEAMENAATLDVELKVDAGIGENWLEAH